MDELLLALIIGFFKLIFWLVLGFFRILRALGRKLASLVTSPASTRTSVAPTQMKQAKQTKHAPPAAKHVDVLPRVRQHLETTQALRLLCDEQRNTRRFLSTLDGLVERAERMISQLRIDSAMTTAARAALVSDEGLRKIVGELADERRGPLSGLLDDTDALANASYAPIVDYCRQRDIALASDRAATAIDGDKLYFMSMNDPAGLTTIVLPTSFSTEITTWPAIAHEIGHDFFRSVDDLGIQLRMHLGCGSDIALLHPSGGQPALAQIPQHAIAAWMEELFADAFGTMMLGPAYLETMMKSFASPAEPEQALAMASLMQGKVPVYEEHPPGHVRVVAGCRLLGRMGYGKEADGLEARWRKQHGDPSVVFSPLADGRWLRMDEAAIIPRAEQVGTTLYMTGLDCLRGQPLRSVAGLDFGPREHETARRLAERLASGRSIEVADPRLLVAGAVLATVAAPSRAAGIYALARDAIEGVDTPEEERALRTEVAGFEVDASAAREAFLVGELLGPPRCRL